VNPLQISKTVCYVAVVLLGQICAIAASPEGEGVEFFEKKIRPILADNCYKCHSKTAEKLKGGLLLDTREGFLKGGDTGPAIVPGDVDKSLLIKAVRYTDENLQMPPKGKKISSDQIAALEEWVKAGAPAPAESANPSGPSIQEKAKAHWAFQPVREPKIPAVKNHRWARNPLDSFVLAKLESYDLEPSPEADKRTLIRRATYDLTGLPPTPAEVAAFVADRSPDAFDKVVERLLASQQYGERWGRHWLDVARYADTKGYVFEEERRYPYAYTYRDYVIRAFNEDLPYDQFVVQQIAADLLPLEKDKRPLAALGFLTLGRRFVNNIHDITDDRIDVVCRGTMALTVACARCHDHKYDPIPTRDYYSLYGIFASSTEPEEQPLLGLESEPKAREQYLAERKKRIDERVNFRKTKQEELLDNLRKQTSDYLYVAQQALSDKGKLEDMAHERKLHPPVVRRWRESLENWAKTNQPVFVPWFKLAALAQTEFGEKARAICEQLLKDPTAEPEVAKALADKPPANLKEAAEVYARVLSAEGAGKAVHQILYGDDGPIHFSEGEFDPLFDVPVSQKLRELQRKIDELDATHVGAPPRAMAFVDKPKPHNAHVFLRGNPDKAGPEVPRQFLELLAGPGRKPFETGSGRLELAQAIVRPDNPLTARVLVNRVWLHHFGAGLVRTPGDFGLRSETPTNGELLDYLAARFVREGWSVKRLHRWIMLSSTYRQSSMENPRAMRIDPNNQLLWRMNRQRLDFEETRDTLLALSGKLDPAAGGHSVDILSEPFSHRRTVYGYIDRQNLPALLRAFDFASPDATCAQRFYTTVPQQALFLMNNAFVLEQAKSLVHQRSFESCSTPEGKTKYLYHQIFQREPTTDEMAWASEFRHAQPAEGVAPLQPVWQYGYGEFDDTTKSLKKFVAFPHFTGTEFQGGKALPDGQLGWAMLNESGGHAGNDLQHAVIRRWIAPRDGVLSLKGKLNHPAEQGDGIRARVLCSGRGLIAEWKAHHKELETSAEKVAVKKGETIDFMVDCCENVSYDSFSWEMTLTLKNEKTGPEKWGSKKDFAESARAKREPLNTWEKYAQALLLANEVMFVD
jgi:hypothetical protein